MTIKQLIKEIEERGRKLTKGLESEVIIGHTYSEGNISINTAFIYLHEEKLYVVSSYYHYFVKYEFDGVWTITPPFLNVRDAIDWIDGNNLKEFGLWRDQNGKAELLFCSDYEDWTEYKNG